MLWDDFNPFVLSDAVILAFGSIFFSKTVTKEEPDGFVDLRFPKSCLILTFLFCFIALQGIVLPGELNFFLLFLVQKFSLIKFIFTLL
jgi:hypothetical protein